MIYQLCLIFLQLFLSTRSYRLFSQKPSNSFVPQLIQLAYISPIATVVKISPDGTKFFVGTTEGSLFLYNISDTMKLDQYFKYESPLSQIKKIEWVSEQIILILNGKGQVKRINDQLQLVNTYMTRKYSTINDFAVSSKDGHQFIAVSMPQLLRQIYLQNMDNYWNYHVKRDAKISQVQFSAQGHKIFSYDSSSNIQIFDRQTRKRQQNSINIDGTLKKMQLLSQGKICGLTDKNKLFKFDENHFQQLEWDSNNENINTFVGCKGTDQIVLAMNNYQNSLRVINTKGNTRQILNYLGSNRQIKSMDCNQNYLVTLDNTGQVTIHTIQLKQIQQAESQIQYFVEFYIFVFFLSILCLGFGLGIIVSKLCKKQKEQFKPQQQQSKNDFKHQIVQSTIQNDQNNRKNISKMKRYDIYQARNNKNDLMQIKRNIRASVQEKQIQYQVQQTQKYNQQLKKVSRFSKNSLFSVQ